MVAPGQWHNLRIQDEDLQFPMGGFQLRGCRHIGGDNIYNFQLLGAKDLIMKFAPDWLIVQQEPESILAQESVGWAKELGCKFALFTWQNIRFQGGYEVLRNSDLVVCGNPEAERLVKPWNVDTLLLLQVGVDTDHFQARPGVERNVEVGYIGRPNEEKGIRCLIQAWPTARILEWKDFKELPWWYSQVRVIVAYSQDTSEWKEQAPNYVTLEALSCGCDVVTSDTEAMKYWNETCPVGYRAELNPLLETKEEVLRKAIQKALSQDVGNKGRQWVIDNFSNHVVAKKLLETLKGSC